MTRSIFTYHLTTKHLTIPYHCDAYNRNFRYNRHAIPWISIC